MNNDLIDGLKLFYVEARQKVVPHYKLPPNTHEKDFEKAADICVSLEVDPKTFIDAQFKASQDGGKTLFPQFLHSKFAADNVKEYMKLHQFQLDELIETWKTYLYHQLKTAERKLENVLLDDKIDIPAWWRIVVTKSTIPTVLNKYLQTAKKQVTPAIVQYCRANNLDIDRILK